MITIKAYRAREGDAFLITFNSKSEIRILLDMGLSSTYEEHIKPDLIKLNEQGKHIDLLVISHIDNDHINGAIKFIKENGNNSKIIQVNEVWFNSFPHMIFNRTFVDKLSDSESEILKKEILINSYNNLNNGLNEIGISEGETLTRLLFKYKYKWNTSFSNRAVSIENGAKIVLRELNIQILSPNRKKLKNLSNEWEKKLDEKKYGFNICSNRLMEDSFELMLNSFADEAEKPNNTSHINTLDIEKLAEQKTIGDKSLTNGSSISILMEYKGKKLLFLGDAHEDIIYKELCELTIRETLKVDLLKVSHHGSKNNISNRLLDLVKSKKFLISSNGVKYSHPSHETIAKIIKTKGFKEIIFNYDNPIIKQYQNIELENKYNYCISTLNEIIC